MNDELKIKNNELGGKMNYRYRTDDEMKDSGVEWIGKIPKKWSRVRVGHLCEIGRGRVISSEEIMDNTGLYPVYSSQTKDNGVMGYINTYDFQGEYVTWTTDGANAGTVFKRNGKFNCTNVCGTLKNRSKELDLSFLAYALSIETKPYVRLDINPKLMNNEMSNIKVCITKNYEQRKIAKFLDEKTAQFDSIISKKEALIEKLEEAKKSLISEVVTGKGKVVKSNDGYELVKRKKEEMKDSGVEWLEDIPKEWDLKRSNYVFKFSKGLSITKENLQDEGIPCINYGEIHSKYGFEVNPKRHKLKCVTEEYFNSNPNALIKYGDFVFADTSEDIQGCGNFSYLNAEDSIFAGYHTIIARPIKTVSSRYLAYLFDSDDWRIQIRTKVSGIKVFSITQSILKTTKVILPTLSEQKLIVDYLDNKFVSINSIINNMKKQIEKLKEAKQSLISEAVTGKIEILD